ncbi:hypothetical protein NL108_000558 [Boleophthalmus pectinirostris]|nr:hypothetical protein NL108_000558 [Boleophthalmus pectinirostris]
MVWVVLRLILQSDLYIKMFTLTASRGRSRLVCQYLLLFSYTPITPVPLSLGSTAQVSRRKSLCPLCIMSVDHTITCVPLKIKNLNKLIKTTAKTEHKWPQKENYKLQVVKYAAENGNQAAEKKFGVSEKLVTPGGCNMQLSWKSLDGSTKSGPGILTGTDVESDDSYAKEEAAPCLPLEVAELLRSDTEDEEFNGFNALE